MRARAARGGARRPPAARFQARQAEHLNGGLAFPGRWDPRNHRSSTFTTEFAIAPEYHTQYDTADRVDFDYLAKLTEVCARLLLDAPPGLDFDARARELRGVPHPKLQRALDDLAKAKGRKRFTAVGRGLHGLDAIDAPRYPHEQTAADIALLEQALADPAKAERNAHSKVGLNWLCSDLSHEAFKRERARRDRNAPRACWGAQGDADPGPDLWRELASLRGEPGARPPGPWLGPVCAATWAALAP